MKELRCTQKAKLDHDFTVGDLYRIYSMRKSQCNIFDDEGYLVTLSYIGDFLWVYINGEAVTVFKESE